MRKRCFYVFQVLINITFFCNAIRAPFKGDGPFHTLKFRSARGKGSPWNRHRYRHMFDRPTKILEITRKICPRGVQNRKSNKKGACRYAEIVGLYDKTVKLGKGFYCDKSDSLWLDNLSARGNQWNCANWFRRYPWSISARLGEKMFVKLLLFFFHVYFTYTRLRSIDIFRWRIKDTTDMLFYYVNTIS